MRIVALASILCASAAQSNITNGVNVAAVNETFEPFSANQTFEPFPGNVTFEPFPGNQTFEPFPGNVTFEPFPGNVTFEPFPGNQTFEPFPGNQTFEPLPDTDSPELPNVNVTDEPDVDMTDAPSNATDTPMPTTPTPTTPTPTTPTPTTPTPTTPTPTTPTPTTPTPTTPTPTTPTPTTPTPTTPQPVTQPPALAVPPECRAADASAALRLVCCSTFNVGCQTTCTVGVVNAACCEAQGIGCSAAQLAANREASQQTPQNLAFQVVRAVLTDELNQLETSPKGVVFRVRRALLLLASLTSQPERLVIVSIGSVAVPPQWNNELHDVERNNSLTTGSTTSRDGSVLQSNNVAVEYRIQAPSNADVSRIVAQLSQSPAQGLRLTITVQPVAARSTSSSDDDDAVLIGVLVGVLGGLLVIGVIVAVIVLRRRKQAGNRNTADHEPVKDESV